MNTSSRRKFFAGLAVAPPALWLASDAKACGHRKGHVVAADCDTSPVPCPELGQCDPTLPPYTEFGIYSLRFDVAISQPIETVRLDFVDRWTRRVRGILSARNTSAHPHDIIYRPQPGTLIVTGQIMRHTLHLHDGVADVFVFINGEARPLGVHQTVCYKYHVPSFARCLDPEFNLPVVQGTTATIYADCTVPANTTINTAQFDFFDVTNPSVHRGHLRAKTDENNVIYDPPVAGSTAPGRITLTGVVSPDSNMTIAAQASITVTINDTPPPVCTNCRTVCYRTS